MRIDLQEDNFKKRKFSHNSRLGHKRTKAELPSMQTLYYSFFFHRKVLKNLHFWLEFLTKYSTLYNIVLKYTVDRYNCAPWQYSLSFQVKTCLIVVILLPYESFRKALSLCDLWTSAGLEKNHAPTIFKYIFPKKTQHFLLLLHESGAL